MLWRRRSSSLSSNSVGPDHIEQLNSRFRLRIPMSTKSNIRLKETLFHSDDSTCSARSSRSNQSSIGTARVKRVRFFDQVVEFLPIIEFPSDEEVSTIWFSQAEIADIKIALRNIWKGPHINDANFVNAVEVIRQLFDDNNDTILRKSNDTKSAIADSLSSQQILTYKECARVLATNEGRGLERMYYGTSTFSKVGAKSLHVQRYVASVLETQEKLINCSIDARATAIAAQCQSLPSVLWARVVADFDLESVNNDVKPSLGTIFLRPKCRESIEI
jgi:hypothetical protein